MRSPNDCSNSSLLDHWWFTACPPATTVGTEADHSLESTTASRLSSTRGGTSGPRVITVVTGTCPLRNPSSAERRVREGVQVAVHGVTGEAGHGGRTFNGGESVSGRLDDAQYVASGGIAGERLTVTMGSMPPPNGMRGRPGVGRVGGRRRRRRASGLPGAHRAGLSPLR